MASTKITRADLYELVWKTPMSRLASEFGISDVALAKTCKRLSVPRPGRGYWAQLAARVKMKRPPLGKPPPGADEWTFVQRVAGAVPRTPRPRAPEVPVPIDLRGAPDSIRRLGLALGAATKDEHERLVIKGPGDPVIAVTIATHRRALLLLAGLAAAAGHRGHDVTLRDEGGVARLSLELGGVTLGLSIVERLEQKDHVLTPEEERKAATGYRYGIPKHDYFTGRRLKLSLQDTRGTQTSWSDTRTRTLDGALGAVILAAESEALRRKDARLAEERRREEDERRRVAEEEERGRQRLRKARADYQERLAADLRRMARAWSDAEEIRRFVGAVRDALPLVEDTERATNWLRWAESYANTLDPLSRLVEVPKEIAPTDEQLRER